MDIQGFALVCGLICIFLAERMEAVLHGTFRNRESNVNPSRLVRFSTRPALWRLHSPTPAPRGGSFSSGSEPKPQFVGQKRMSDDQELAASEHGHSYGRVNIKVFRGPDDEHNHFAPHGYWVKQPADDGH